MSIFEELEKRAKKIVQEIEEKRNELREISDCVKRLSKPDVLPIGARVRLKENWSIKEVGDGWKSYRHFMIPSNIATVRDISVYKGKISYYLKFDNQTCHYSFAEGSYEVDGVFNFNSKDVEAVN